MKKNLITKIISMSLLCAISMCAVSRSTYGHINEDMVKDAMRCLKNNMFGYLDTQDDREDKTANVLECMMQSDLLKTEKEQALTRCMSRCDSVYGSGYFWSDERYRCKRNCFDDYRL